MTNRSSSTSSSSAVVGVAVAAEAVPVPVLVGGGAQKVLKANYLPDLWVRSSLKLPSTALLDATGSVYDKHKISSFLMQPSPPMAPWISFMRSAFSALKCLMLESWSKSAPQKLKWPKMPKFLWRATLPHISHPMGRETHFPNCFVDEICYFQEEKAFPEKQR